jgi:hypothetical protein
MKITIPKSKSLLTTLILIILPITTIMILSVDYFLLIGFQKLNMENSIKSCEQIVELNANNISEELQKTVNELKGELIIQIECFKVSYESYVKKYKHYDFPDDYDEEKTLEELKNIEKNINEKDKKYYQSIIKLLNGDTNIPSFDEDLDELEEEGENSDKKDPKLQLETDIPIMRCLDRIRKNLKKNYLEDPMNCRVKLNLDEPFEKNEELQEIVKKLDSKLKNKKGKNKPKLMHKCKSLEIICKEEQYKIDDKNRHSRSNSVHIFSVKKNIFNYEGAKDLEKKSEYSECTSGNCSGDEIEDYK